MTENITYQYYRSEEILESEGELDSEHDSETRDKCYIKIVYKDATLKKIHSSKLRRLDQIVVHDFEVEMDKYRAKMKESDENYRNWSKEWSKHQQ